MGLPVRNLTIVEESINPNQYSKLDFEFFENFSSAHTKRSYQLDIEQFFNFLGNFFKELKSLNEIERVHIVAFRNHLTKCGGKEKRQAAPKTIGRKLASISTYFDFLIEKEILKSNPVSAVKRPKQEVLRPTEDFSDEQVMALFEKVDLDQKSGPLHKAILAMFFATGMRKSELIHLRGRDLEEVGEFIVINYLGKGGKQNRTPLPQFTIDAIKDYLQWMKDQCREVLSEDPLFQPTKNPKEANLKKSMNPKSIDYIFKSYAKKLGIAGRFSPHSARATVIGSLLEKGVDIYKVAQLVNHSSVNTTQMYDKRRKQLKESPVFDLDYFRTPSKE